MQGDKWQFWIDIGGTFTDVAALAPDNKVITYKLLSKNPEQYQDAVLAGIREILGLKTKQAIPMDSIDSVKVGTTVATNALLEHQGEPTALVITQGFKDALQIAYQNRDASGKILMQLNIEEASLKLQQLYDSGLRAVAIVLMHSYRNATHEIKLKEIATQVGFRQISVSHEVSPLIKLISRGDTTVMDAYLSPKIHHYINEIASALDINKLYFMQSNGGLVKAGAFHGKDAVLSGPAGGLIGAIKTAASANINKIISFDMGGTSTDVAHYAGELERSSEFMLAGTALRAPMLRIHTIAAGGGSILRFDQGRLQVGPQSAGANPGPACYRGGGPITLTDCCLLLGRIVPEYFPKVFGKEVNQSLDLKVVKQWFTELQAQINNKSKQSLSIEQIAQGCIDIAVNNMANAIKKISIERGHDVTEYTLCCFGGAGAQYACEIADQLNMKQVLIYPHAGVLSAYGIGLADLCLLKERSILMPLSKEAIAKCKTELDKLQQQGMENIQAQGILLANI